MTENTTESAGTTRRDVLKKAAVGGAVVWTAPLITSRPAFALGTLGTDKCQCEDGSNGGGVTQITYRFDSGPCNDPPDSGRCADPDSGQVGPLGCSGDTTGESPVKVRAFRQTGTFSEDCSYSESEEHAISLNGDPGSAVTGGVLVNSGQEFTTFGTLNPNSTFVLYDPADDSVLQTICYHYSCSQPLCINDQHGSLTVIDYEVEDPCND